MQQPYQLSQAEGHLKVLKVFHYVYAGLTLLGIGFLVLHYFLMTTMMENMPAEMEGVEDPEFEKVMGMMIWFYVAGAVVFLLYGALNLLSAVFMGKRKSRIFSIVIAGLNCLYIPLGTILGIFTIIFLLKPAAQVVYGEQDPSNFPQS